MSWNTTTEKGNWLLAPEEESTLCCHVMRKGKLQYVVEGKKKKEKTKNSHSAGSALEEAFWSMLWKKRDKGEYQEYSTLCWLIVKRGKLEYFV